MKTMELTSRHACCFVFEIDLKRYAGSPWWKPGFHKAQLNGCLYWRVCWFWFAIAYIPMSDYDHHQYVAAGNTQWRL